MGIYRLHAQSVDSSSFLNEYMNEVLDMAGKGLCIINANAQIEYANAEFCRLFNVSSHTCLNQSFYQICSDELVRLSMKRKSSHQGTIRFASKTYRVETTAMTRNADFVGLKVTFEPQPHDVRMIETLPTQKDNPFESVIGQNSRFVDELLIAHKASKRDVTVLLRGESGTGKELIAKAIHDHSLRSEGPFIAINCAAIPENLIESELLGYESGAFTGANKQKIGQFELANGGTLFLDEIGDLPYHLQVKLLRVLQERTIRRVGGHENIPIDVRVIAATHQDIESMIEEKRFREDLYYRLNVISVTLIPLRERKDDLEHLVNYFVNHLSERHQLKGVTLSTCAQEALTTYDWPGNIRELRNVIERALILMEDKTITMHALPSQITGAYKGYDTEPLHGLINLKLDGQMATLEEYEEAIINLAVERFGSFNSAGRALGITHNTVASKYRKFKAT